MHTIFRAVATAGLVVAVGLPLAGPASGHTASGHATSVDRSTTAMRVGECVNPPDAVACTMLDTEGRKIRAVARTTAKAAHMRVSVTRVRLQFRPCGQKWTTVAAKADPDGSQRGDTDRTRFVRRHKVGHYRSKASFVIKYPGHVEKFRLTGNVAGTCQR